MPNFDIDTLCYMVHENARDHGWWPKGKSAIDLIPEKIALIHSELSEALECFRKGELAEWMSGAHNKPEGFGVELADAIVRICDLYEAVRREFGPTFPDLNSVISRKHEYNRTRPFRHGGKKA